MCQFIGTYEEQEFIGYKVAIKIDGEYYSPAMGCKYPKNGQVPVVKKQNRMTCHFNDEILCGAYEERMVGRTAAFRSVDAARLLARMICTRNPQGDVVVLTVKLTQDLLQGNYTGYYVVAGKHMEILEEMQFELPSEEY